MSNNKTIPRKDVDFNVWQNIITAAARENHTAWLLDDEWLEHQVLPARNAWVEASRSTTPNRRPRPCLRPTRMQASTPR